MKTVSKHSDSGKIVYTSEIITQIVKCAFDEIKGVELATPKTSSVSGRYKQGIKIDTVGDEVHVDVFVKQCHEVNVRDTAFKIQQNIKNSLESMTEFKVKAVNVHVIDVDYLTAEGE